MNYISLSPIDYVVNIDLSLIDHTDLSMIQVNFTIFLNIAIFLIIIFQMTIHYNYSIVYLFNTCSILTTVLP